MSVLFLGDPTTVTLSALLFILATSIAMPEFWRKVLNGKLSPSEWCRIAVGAIILYFSYYFVAKF